MGLFFSSNTDPEYRIIGQLLPFVLLGQGVANLASATANDGAGLRWGKRFDNAFFPLRDTFAWFLIDFAIYYVAAMLIDYYLGREDPRVWLRYLCIGKRVNRKGTVNVAENGYGIPVEVQDERNRVANDKDNKKFAIRIDNIFKNYYAYQYGVFPDTKKDFLAVNGLSLGVEPGELLCLLGPNGGTVVCEVKSDTLTSITH